MDAVYKNLEDFLLDADRAETLKYVEVQGDFVRAWFSAKWWLAVYEASFEDKKERDELVAKLVEHGFKEITVRPSPIIRGA